MGGHGGRAAKPGTCGLQAGRGLLREALARFGYGPRATLLRNFVVAIAHKFGTARFRSRPTDNRREAYTGQQPRAPVDFAERQFEAFVSNT